MGRQTRKKGGSTVGERAVIKLGKLVGLSRLKSIEFYRMSKRQPMRCVLCQAEEVKGRHYRIEAIHGLTVYGVCTPCNVEGHLNERITAHVEKHDIKRKEVDG